MLTTVLLHVPPVQSWIGERVEVALSEKLGTKVIVEQVDLGFLNRVIVDGLTIFDQKGEKMLSTSRLSAKINIFDLFDGRVTISSAQLFGMKVVLYKENEASPLNCQFVIDSLSSKDTTQTHPLNLRIASLVIRNGEVKYDRRDMPQTQGVFSPHHISARKISSHLMIYALTNDSTNISIKNLAFEESCGFNLSRLSLSFLYNKNKAEVKDFILRTPNSSIELEPIIANYETKGDSILISSLSFKGSTKNITLSPKDLQCFVNHNISTLPNIYLNSVVKGNASHAKGSFLVETTDKSMSLSSSIELNNLFGGLEWKLIGTKISSSEQFISKLHNIIEIPQPILKLGKINISGNAQGTKNDIQGDLSVITSNAGELNIKGSFLNSLLNAKVIAKGVQLGTILGIKDLGELDCNLTAKSKIIDGVVDNVEGLLNIDKLYALNYGYQGITSEFKLNKTSKNSSLLKLFLDANDPNLTCISECAFSITNNKVTSADINAYAERIVPGATGFTNEWGNSAFSFNCNANINGSDIDNITGNFDLEDFTIHGGHKSLEDITLQDQLTVKKCNISMQKEDDGRKHFTLESDFANVDIKGIFKPSTIPSSFTRLIYKYISNIPSLQKPQDTNNNFTFNANISSLEFIHRLLGTDINIAGNAILQGYQNDETGSSNVFCNIPSIHIDGKQIDNIKMLIWTPSNSLNTTISATLNNDSQSPLKLDYEGRAENDIVTSVLKWQNLSGETFKGTVNTLANFTKQADGSPMVNVSIEPSDIQLGDTVMHLHSKGIYYSDKNLIINNFAIENERQHVYINGRASTSSNDTLVAELKDINIAYIMNLVDFHSVEFGGYASGKAIGYSLFDKPQAQAQLRVRDFLFQYGNLGTLDVNADLNNIDERIDIIGHAIDDQKGRLDIFGYVSPQRECLDLDLRPNGASIEFMQSFCSSFMKDIDARIKGHVRVFGAFSDINLEGKAIANGEFTVSSLNTRYALKNDTVIFVPDDITIANQPIYDIYGHEAFVTGGLHHKHLTKMTYDFDIKTNNFLCYDFKEFGADIFYGTAFLTGDCQIIGRSSELNINVTGNVESGSKVVYNASSPDAISQQEFITWNSVNSKHNTPQETSTINNTQQEPADVRTNMHMNFLVNITDKSLLRVIMDKASGDYIELNGEGTLRAQYYNKGGLDLFGSYYVNKGIYHMTIQNVIRRDFEFQQGGNITFGGNPFGAQLNLLAKYTVNSVPLSDLNIGQSFSNNNIRVDCLMNIKGTAGGPLVEFDMNLPTVNSDAKQMIYSLINSEEEMNQQVIYLLSVGRFYAQAANNSSIQEANRGNRTSMAMQSLLSGTLSQQLGNVLGSFLNSSKWTVGANISPGNEGFDNAEYEGIVNGSLLNNRLLINGQFGYRDNALTSQQGFIGDFDIRYMLVPNGNYAVRVYNQTNDRYFTRNSLNTQGLGVIIKKDFNTWRDLFRFRKKK